MIFLHETHEVVGGEMPAFEAAVREHWQPRIERDARARLLWFWHLTHGTGASYQAISITAVRDWTTWGEIVAEMRDDTWAPWWQAVSALRHDVVSKLMLPVHWSPLREIDLADPPVVEGNAVHLHDTGWPYRGGLDAYVDALGSIFYPQTQRYRMVQVAGCWVTAPGTGRHHEVLLLQNVTDWTQFAQMLVGGERPSKPGDWMQEGLKYRERWESKLVRPVSWSPWK